LRMDEKRLKAWKDRKDKRMDYFLEGVRLFQEATGYPVTFHDVLLVAYLIDRRVVTLKKGHFAVELSGRLNRGTMVDMTNYYEINPEVNGFPVRPVDGSERFYHCRYIFLGAPGHVSDRCASLMEIYSRNGL
ncbi:hypothetical protein, partial [Enterocloster sp.]|uniref:hypothetical protein n=1 Tax=Enterocloster sp. TaxID=2719315 RepID=UPI0039A25B71